MRRHSSACSAPTRATTDLRKYGRSGRHEFPVISCRGSAQAHPISASIGSHQQAASRSGCHDHAPSPHPFLRRPLRSRRLDRGLRRRRRAGAAASRHPLSSNPAAMAGGLPAEDCRDRRHPCLRSLDAAGADRSHRRPHQCAQRGYHRAARRLCCRSAPGHAHHSGERMGQGAGRPESAARRPCRHGQP